MRPDSGLIHQALLHGLPAGAALCVAFSGGRDSTVLLYALAKLRGERRFELRAAHVNHALQAVAPDWERHVMEVATRLDVPCSVQRVVVRSDHSQGLEAAAREARYDALRSQLGAGAWLLTAHHADDQLETVLLHLLRGSGVSGLTGVPRDVPFGHGRLCRPLLAVPAEAVQAYATEILEPAGIGWLNDPMNADPAYDRGYIRHQVAPVLRGRFPAVARAAARSAALAAEAVAMLEDLARADAQLVLSADRLALAPLRALGPARQHHLVRHLVRERGWAVPPERRLREGMAQLLEAAPGRQPVLRWGGHEIRRFRQHLYLLDTGAEWAVADATPHDWRNRDTLVLGGPRGELGFSPQTGAGLAPDIVAEGLQVMFRSGGERVRADGDRHHRTLKYLFQTYGVVPWMRCHVPLVFAAGKLAAVADLWTADWAAARPSESGLAIVWRRHAPIR
ncbi:MAG: tRNA lysidine(34) synthetase TilS [Gammaproteobacteria bacterium]|nr:tRNA lysidine(34) synthetase TilS [Gammaproteobacteria bacterium]